MFSSPTDLLHSSVLFCDPSFTNTTNHLRDEINRCYDFNLILALSFALLLLISVIQLIRFWLLSSQITYQKLLFTSLITLCFCKYLSPFFSFFQSGILRNNLNHLFINPILFVLNLLVRLFRHSLLILSSETLSPVLSLFSIQKHQQQVLYDVLYYIPLLITFTAFTQLTLHW